MTELEPPLVKILMHRLFLAEQQRDKAAAIEGESELAKPLEVLNGALRERPYFLGDAFTIADLNVYSMVA